MTVNDVQVGGRFIVETADRILHVFAGYGSGDIAPDVACREVVRIFRRDRWTHIVVKGD